MTINIYTLSDPDTGRVEYVGQTGYPIAYRMNRHICHCRQGDSAKNLWIRSLIDAGKMPQVELIEQCSSTDASEREAYWIAHHLSINPYLKNGAPNGPERTDDPVLTERFQIAMTAEDKEKLDALAESNTGSNKSLLLRKLIDQAYTTPGKFDLHPPKTAGPRRRVHRS